MVEKYTILIFVQKLVIHTKTVHEGHKDKTRQEKSGLDLMLLKNLKIHI